MKDTKNEEAPFTAADARRNTDAGKPPKVPTAEEIKMSPLLPAFKAAVIECLKEASHGSDSYCVTLPPPHPRCGPWNDDGEAYDVMMRASFLRAFGIEQPPEKLTAADVTWLLLALGDELRSYPLDFTVRHVPSKGSSGGRIGGTVTYSAEYLHVSW